MDHLCVKHIAQPDTVLVEQRGRVLHTSESIIRLNEAREHSDMGCSDTPTLTAC